ncbi:MAG: hypothetical protein V2J25_10960 [Desulfatiglans sp.]|jgi:hypothetical protein|nr:hypothetical protein [Desulfatiglans sp.]
MDSDKIIQQTQDTQEGFSNELLSFSQGISLDWLDQHRGAIQRTPEFQRLVELFPPLEERFRQWEENDPPEFLRTLVHTFQTQAAYNRVCAGSFPESGLEEAVIKKVKDLADRVFSFSPILLPVILWLHDIGRSEDKQRHNEKSAEMISALRLLDDRGFMEEEIRLIRTVVQYHLLIGTLYTGESSYLSFYQLIDDKAFGPILEDPSSTARFLDSLTLFTIIDVWGYHINDISPIMIDNYLDIRREMASVFSDADDLEAIKSGLRERSRRHVDWRLMGFMMAFSKIGKRPHLTLDFYRDLILRGFEAYKAREQLAFDWDEFKEKSLHRLDQVQFKYGLGVLIPLGYGGTGRKMHLKDDTLVSPDLFHLLICINNRIEEEEKNSRCIPDSIWNVLFKGYPPWNRYTNFFERLKEPGLIGEIISQGEVHVDEKEGVNTLIVNYRGYWNDLESEM